VGHFQEAFAIMLRLLTGLEADPDALAPFVPTPREAITAALDMAQVTREDVFYDLGCGDGRVLALAAPRAAKVVGIEKDERRAKLAESLLRQLGVSNGAVLRGKIQDVDISGATVVFVYLLTQSNAVIAEKLETQLRAGARVVSHDFPFPGWDGQRVELKIPGDDRTHWVHCYEIGKHKAAPLVIPEGVTFAEGAETAAAAVPESSQEEIDAQALETMQRLFPDTATVQ
jgi:SAM-dependent methyltransferase